MDLQDPQKGHFGPKRVLLGPLGTQKRPNTRPKCVVFMGPTQADQSAAVGTKSGSPGSYVHIIVSILTTMMTMTDGFKAA